MADVKSYPPSCGKAATSVLDNLCLLERAAILHVDEPTLFPRTVIWSTRPQRGAGRAKDYRPPGVSCGPLDQDTWQAERRNLRVHSVWNGNCSDSTRPDGS
jgi:hypothetical protein